MAVALMLVMSILFSWTLLALMSTVRMSRAASCVRNGKPSMVTDGLLVRFADDWILLAIMFCAYALAIWSATTKSTASTTMTLIQRDPASPAPATAGRSPGPAKRRVPLSRP